MRGPVRVMIAAALLLLGLTTTVEASSSTVDEYRGHRHAGHRDQGAGLAGRLAGAGLDRPSARRT